MRAYALALILLLASAPALADSEARQGKDWVRIFDAPCVSAETLGRIPPQAREQFHKAQGVVRGEKFFGCWQWIGDFAYILWDDGDEGAVPKSDFKPVLEI